MKRRAVVAFAALILALTALAGAVCARADVAAAFSRDWSVHVTFGSTGKLTVYFSPDISSTYDLYAFDSDSGLIRRAVLRRDGEIVAQSSGKQLLMNVGLSAGQNYALELEGEGECDIELMRHAAGRSILMATELAGQNSGQILRPGSVVWHSISIDGARASIYITPEPQRGLSLRAGIYTASGRLAATSSEMPGGGCRVDKVVENEWMRIPHFYRSFYVYKYATSFCAAVALADKILHGTPEDVAAYRRFLTLGGSMSPIEELKTVGIDMSTPAPIEAALDVFASLLADFQQQG